MQHLINSHNNHIVLHLLLYLVCAGDFKPGDEDEHHGLVKHCGDRTRHGAANEASYALEEERGSREDLWSAG